MFKRICVLSTIILLLCVFLWAIARFFSTHKHRDQYQSTNSACTTDSTDIPPIPVITVKDITLRETEKCKGYEIIVHAEESRFHHLSDIVDCQNVNCKINKNNGLVADIQAPKASIDRNKHNAFFYGPVHGKFKDLEFNGYDINYTFSDQIVSSEKSATYSHPQFFIRAQHSVIDMQKKTIKMSNGVHCEFSYRTTSNNCSH